MNRGAHNRFAAGLLLAVCGCAGKEEPAPPPPSPDAPLFEGAMRRQRAGDFGGALAAFEQLCGAHPDSPHAQTSLFWIGFDQSALGEDRKALSSLARLVARWPKGAYADDAYFKAHQIHVRGASDEDQDQARVDLETLLERFPDSPFAGDARLGLAQLAEGAGRTDRALTLYREMLERGDATAPRERIERWIRKIEGFRSASPDRSARFLKGRHLFLRGRFEAAFAQFEAAAGPSEDGLGEESGYYAALCLTHLSRWPKALEYFRRLSSRASDEELRKAAGDGARTLSAWIAAASGE